MPPLPQELRIGQRAVTHAHDQAVRVGERIEIVTRKVRRELAREHERAHDLRLEDHARALELRLEERMIEARVVRDDEAAFEPAREFPRDIRERRRRAQQRVGEPRGAAAFDEGGPTLDPIAVDENDADLGDAMVGRGKTVGLDVDEREAFQEDHPAIIERMFDGRVSGRTPGRTPRTVIVTNYHCYINNL